MVKDDAAAGALTPPPLLVATAAADEDRAAPEPTGLDLAIERSCARAAAADEEAEAPEEHEGSGKADTARLSRRVHCPSIAEGSCQ